MQTAKIFLIPVFHSFHQNIHYKSFHKPDILYSLNKPSRRSNAQAHGNMPINYLSEKEQPTLSTKENKSHVYQNIILVELHSVLHCSS